MLFNSLEFGLFFPLVFVLYALLRRTERARFVLLLAASWVFYGTWSWRYLGLILFSTVLDYWIGKALAATDDARLRKRLVAVSVVTNLGVLSVFKYFDFFSRELAALLGQFGWSVDPFLLNVALPVGISFYTFQTLSYTIDVYRGELAAESSFLRFALFVAFFPQLVAGPIVRASEFLPQLRRPACLDREGFDSGLALVAWGLTKKVLLADQIGRAFVDVPFEAPQAFGGGVTLLAVYAYCFQIYCDFSGYSDVARGLARMLGFELPLNFDSPYKSPTSQIFWRRWHMSLSFWIRDYVYIPLGGNRGRMGRRIFTVVLTMALAGLWHGANRTFLVFGLLNGAFIVISVLTQRRGSTRSAGFVLLGTVLTFHGWALSMIPFRAADLEGAWAVFRSLFTPGAGVLETSLWSWAALSIAVLTHFLPGETKRSAFQRFVGMPPELKALCYALLLGVLMNASTLSRPFIYFQF